VTLFPYLKRILVFGAAASALYAALPSHPQQSDTLQATTQEHLDTEPFWPTMSTLPLDAFAGSATCTRCHADEAAAAATSMQRAATPAVDAKFLKAQPIPAYASPPFTYTLAPNADYTVTSGPHKLTARLDWSFGAGDLGRTFLYQSQNRWYQSRATFYTAPARLDITTGVDPATPGDLSLALGQPLSPEDASRCFSCHTVHSTTASGFNPLHAEAGLGCEACHGPALAHVKKMNAAASSVAAAHGATADSSVFNPARLSPSDSNDFCGACHRSFADATLSISTTGAVSTAVVRFQPYRLEESKCWRATRDARLTCVACHDPHQPLNRVAASYDRNCLQCHARTAAEHPASDPVAPAHAAKACPRATSQCVSCHMPKVNVASMYGDFTDHLIRVAREGEPFPP
jgi:hypothetical protein